MKKNLLLIIFIVATQFCKAQTYDTTTYFGKSGYIFNYVSHTQITTGLLRDYGIDFLNLDNFGGNVLNDSNWVSLPEWRSLYASLYSDQINSPAAMLYLDTINNLIGKFAQSNLPVTFVCMYYNYNVLDSNAITKKLMTVSNGQLRDVAGRTQSPYLLHSVFAIAPTQQNVLIGSNQLILRPELFINNTGKTISNLQIDPKGSSTYQTVSFNTPITVSYDTAGLYTINFKVTYADGTINYSHTKLAAFGNSNGLASLNRHKNEKEYKGYGPPCYDDAFIYGTHYPYVPIDFTADKAYQSIAAKGDYTIDLSVNNTTGKIQKPLIIISGFDPDAVDDYTGLTYIDDYLTRIDYDENYLDYYNHPIPLNGINGLDNADSYDIIYLHWHNGTDYIERNAYLLEKLIALVNSIKHAAGSTQQNVIMGTSMGGLVARWALRDMEINNIVHDTRLFISDDAPHWGANVPPAYQALVQYIAPWQIINPQIVTTLGNLHVLTISWQDMFPEAINALNIFNSPAAKQMLIQRYLLTGQTLSADNSTHATFMTELNNMGWPLNCRNVVLSNGTCNGTTVFADNSVMFTLTGSQSWTYFGGLWRGLAMSLGGIPGISSIIVPGVPVRQTSLLVQFPLALVSTKQTLNFDFGAWPVPPSGMSLIFKGNVYIHRTILWAINTTSYILKCNVNSTSDMLPLDNAPGSVYDISSFGIDINDVNAQIHKQLGNWVTANLKQPQFCFVPTVSSLALINQQTNLRVSLCNNISCLLPAHISDYYAPQQNQIHISYTTDNSNWILKEQDANYTCLQVCPANLSIAGDNMFCTTSNLYSVVNLPTNASVAWSASPQNGFVQINSPNSTQTTLTSLGGGTQITLSAALTANACGSTQNFNVSKQINVGDILSGNVNNAGQNTSMNTVNSVSAGATEVSFQWPGVTGISCTQSSTSPSTSQTGFIFYPSNNTCWFTLSAGQSITVNFSGKGCAGGNTVASRSFTVGGVTHYSVSPNPAGNTITINSSTPTSNLKTDFATTTNSTTQIMILDVSGNIKQQQQISSNTTTVQMNVSNLLPGTYFVEIISGLNKEIHQIIINR